MAKSARLSLSSPDIKVVDQWSRGLNMNEFSQTSLKGQGLLLLEQGIARVCSIGELVL